MKSGQTALLFPGQGSQARGMGAELFDLFPDMVRVADAILGYSLRSLCVDDPFEQLRQTQFTQPALFAVEALEFLRMQTEGSGRPGIAAGHSLGEYAALFAADAFDFETGLRLVQKRGALMADAPAGGMAAVVGMAEDQIRSVLTKAGFGGIDIANDNAPSQVVIAGLKHDIIAAQKAFEAVGARYVVLNVGAAFHSRYMLPAQDAFADFLERVRIHPPSFPVLSNVTARPHEAATIRQRLVQQITSPVRWTDSIRFLMGQGILAYREIGPGQVLTRLVQQIRNEASPLFDAAAETGSPSAVAVPAATPAAGRAAGRLRGDSLGSPAFQQTYGTRYAYVGGSMMYGVSSAEQVVALTKAGFLGVYGADGVEDAKVTADLRRIRGELAGKNFAVSLIADWNDPERDLERVERYLEAGVPVLEASGFLSASAALVRYRLHGLSADAAGGPVPRNRILARVTRPDAALFFLQPAPEAVVSKLLQLALVTPDEARLARRLPVADDICAQAEGSGPSDGGNLFSLLPAVCRLRDEQQNSLQLAQKVRVGAAGCLGTPEALAAAFVLGADFVLAAAIHQCSPEAGTSEMVKEMLQAIDVADTDRAPSGDLFEQNGQVQVLRRGVFFPARAAKLHGVWRHHPSLDSIDSATRRQIEDKILGNSLNELWSVLQARNGPRQAAALDRAERDPKARMALVFRTYFSASIKSALAGNAGQRVNFQVHCSSGLGGLNRWLGAIAWQQRGVAGIAERLMDETAALLETRRSQLWR